MASEYNAEYEHMPSTRFITATPTIATLKECIDQINRRVERLEAIEREYEFQRQRKAGLL